MGNKQGKAGRHSSTTTAPSKNRASDSNSGQASTAPPPAPVGGASAQQSQQRKVQQQQQPAPPAPPQQPRMHPILENKLSLVDVTTIFAPHEIQAIRTHLASLLGQQEHESITIPKDEFYRVLGATTSSLYVNRLYAIFDMAGKGTVTFDDLIRGLSVLSQKASREQKLLLSFHVLDTEGKGFITKHTTTELLRSCLSECKEIDICLSDDEIARIVESTFDEADLDHNNVVDLQEYQALDVKHPGLFDFLTVDALGVLNHLERVHSLNVAMKE